MIHFLFLFELLTADEIYDEIFTTTIYDKIRLGEEDPEFVFFKR
ncbi:hypothetical protein MBGDF03_00810 [Thermoplasmatales archaeon SCGC AB-540-F20]|nr:hypothetical protein MBGDF03_00810 [Thermoplasmatales archaeon SCGC AB-540-F20]